MDTVGWFARSVDDLLLLHDVLAPQDPATPECSLSGARIAICRTHVWPQADAATRQALDQEAARLRAAGAIVSELELPPVFDNLVAQCRDIDGVEVGYVLHRGRASDSVWV